jgi:hypothetical protein
MVQHSCGVSEQPEAHGGYQNSAGQRSLRPMNKAGFGHVRGEALGNRGPPDLDLVTPVCHHHFLVEVRILKLEQELHGHFLRFQR